MSIKSRKDYLFKKAALKFLTDEMYDDMDNFISSSKIKTENEYQNNFKLIMTRVKDNGYQFVLIHNGKEMNIVKQ